MKCRSKTKAICFYLPQFHPIDENNKWWGAGFTEWHNVVSGRPRFKGHHQPHIPADLGFYDLRLEETRIKQAELAKNHGIYGFCYYHYWFNGKMLLDRPFNDVLNSDKPDFPFCLCWANETWTRAWDGLEREILIKQEYNKEDDINHIKWLVNAFKDSRYIKVAGKPLLLIYRVDNIPNLSDMVSMWNNIAKKNGFNGLHLCAVKTGFTEMSEKEILNAGFDGVIPFQPNRQDFPIPKNVSTLLYNIAQKILPNSIYQALKLSVKSNKIVDYETFVNNIIRKPLMSDKVFPCVFPSWDNTARRKSATIIQNLNPEIYKKWLNDSINKVNHYPDDEKFIFINAWNEWAEGCHLEPDQKTGYSFLKATHDALKCDK